MVFPYFFPLGILLLDDDQTVLDAMAQTFSYMFPGRTVHKTTSSLAAIDFFQDHCLEFSAFPSEVAFNSAEAISETKFEASGSLEALEHHSRDIGMVILDYAMPEMTGIEFSRRIRRHSIPKILLTGQATSDEALRAFNDGLIDRYVTKDGSNVLLLLKEYVLSLEADYFNALNAQFKTLIGKDALPFLFDAVAIQSLTDICTALKVTIVAPSFSPPGLLVSTMSKEKHLLIVMDDETIQSQIEIASFDDGAKNVIAAMAARTHIFVARENNTHRIGAGFHRITPLSAGTYYADILL